MTSEVSKHDDPRRGGAALARLALVAGVLPIVIVHACYGLSVQAGIVPACIPYLTGCTSISATGRHGVSWVLFKAGMIPTAIVMAAYWVRCRDWLLALGRSDGRVLRAMLVLGVVSALFLILYTMFLGSKGDFYDLMRRYGVTVHLSFGVLAQILLTRELLALEDGRVPRALVRGKLLVITLLLGLGLGSIPLKNFVADKKYLENAVEWNFAALMALYFVLTWRAARATPSAR
jgi:hypothetical protein